MKLESILKKITTVILPIYLGCYNPDLDSLRMRDHVSDHGPGNKRDTGSEKITLDSGADAAQRNDMGIQDANYDTARADMVNPDINSDLYKTPDLGRDAGLADSGIGADIFIPYDGSILDSILADAMHDSITYDQGIIDAAQRNDGGIFDGNPADVAADVYQAPDLGRDAGLADSIDSVCSGVVAYYKFDDPEPFQDTCNNHDLTNYGTISSDGPAVEYGQSRDFDGIDDYLSAEDEADLNFGVFENFSMSAWIKLDDTPVEFDTIVGKVLSSVITSGYAIIFDNNSWTCSYWSPDATSSLDTGYALNDSSWHKIECRRTDSGTTAIAYIDDVEIATGAIEPRNTDTPASLVIGNMQQGIEVGRGYFPGYIDEVKISRE